jgi:putative transposase
MWCGPAMASTTATSLLSCCRSIPRSCGPTSTLREHRRSRAGPWPPPAATQGAQANDKNRPGEPEDHALGRSRGGLTTKIHALADAACDLLAVRLTAGQAGDNPQLLPLLGDYLASDYTEAGPLEVRLLADKAYSHPSTRRELRRRRVKHTIPERRDQIAGRKAKGSAGGRPPAFDAEIYKQRNTMERAFNRLKQWRGIATRYDKYALTYLGGVLLAAAIMITRTTSRN